MSDQFEVGYHLVGHTDSVMAADAVYIDRQLLIVSASADCSLRIWQRSEDTVGKILQTSAFLLGIASGIFHRPIKNT